MTDTLKRHHARNPLHAAPYRTATETFARLNEERLYPFEAAKNIELPTVGGFLSRNPLCPRPFGYDRFGGLEGEARRQEKIRQHSLLYGAGPRFVAKNFGLGFLITHQMLEDDMYGQQYVPLSLRSLDAGDKLFMKEMGWTEPQYRLWLREVERESEREQDQKVASIRMDGPIQGRHFDRIVADDMAPLRKDQLNKMIDSLVPGQIYPSRPIAPPPSQRPHVMLTLEHFAVQRDVVTAARIKLREDIKVARDSSPHDPAFDERIDTVASSVYHLLYSTNTLLQIAEEISEAHFTAQVGQGAANATPRG